MTERERSIREMVACDNPSLAREMILQCPAWLSLSEGSGAWYNNEFY